MLKPWRFALIALALIACVLGFWIWRSHGFPIDHEICKHAADGTNYDCAPQNVGLIALREIGEAFSDLTFITALATIAIAAFTGTLWLSTRGMLSATNESVDVAKRALTELERPFFVIESVSSPDVDVYLSPNAAWNEERTNPSFTVSVVNYGRTPGNIDFAAVAFVVSEKIPAEMTRLHLVTANPEGESIEIIVGPDRMYSFPEARCWPRFTHNDARAIRAGTHHIYCHGLFSYVDIFGNSHATKFCRRYWPNRSEWPPEGGRERNRAD